MHHSYIIYTQKTILCLLLCLITGISYGAERERKQEQDTKEEHNSAPVLDKYYKRERPNILCQYKKLLEQHTTLIKSLQDIVAEFAVCPIRIPISIDNYDVSLAFPDYAVNRSNLLLEALKAEFPALYKKQIYNYGRPLRLGFAYIEDACSDYSWEQISTGFKPLIVPPFILHQTNIENDTIQYTLVSLQDARGCKDYLGAFQLPKYVSCKSPLEIIYEKNQAPEYYGAQGQYRSQSKTTQSTKLHCAFCYQEFTTSDLNSQFRCSCAQSKASLFPLMGFSYKPSESLTVHDLAVQQWKDRESVPLTVE
jgi:hypothetical protein